MVSKMIDAVTPTKAGVVAAGSTIGMGGSIAFLVLATPGWLGLWEWPPGALPHLTAIIIAIWGRTGGRWMLS